VILPYYFIVRKMNASFLFFFLEMAVLRSNEALGDWLGFTDDDILALFYNGGDGGPSAHSHPIEKRNSRRYRHAPPHNMNSSSSDEEWEERVVSLATTFGTGSKQQRTGRRTDEVHYRECVLRTFYLMKIVSMWYL